MLQKDVGIIYPDGPPLVDPYSRVAVITRESDAREVFAYCHAFSGMRIFCIDFRAVKIEMVTNVQQARDFFNKSEIKKNEN